MMLTFGMARNEARCSTGWWVRAVLADADGVVGHDVNHRQPHQGGQADGRPGIVGEDEEGRAERDGHRHGGPARNSGAHGVLADPPGDVPLTVATPGQVAAAGNERSWSRVTGPRCRPSARGPCGNGVEAPAGCGAGGKEPFSGA